MDFLHSLSTSTLNKMHDGIAQDIIDLRVTKQNLHPDSVALSDSLDIDIMRLKTVQADIAEEVLGQRGENL